MPERKEHLDALAVALLLVCCLFWGFQQILIKTTVIEVPPLWQASLRFAMAMALLLAWCGWRRVPLLRKDGTLWPGLLAGALFAGEFACIYLGLRDTAASRLTVFLYTAPFVVAVLLPRLVPAEKLRSVQWVGLVIAFGAVAWAFSEGFSGGSNTSRQLRGDAFGLLGGTLWGLTTLVIRASALGKASPEKTLFYQVAVTTAAAPLLSLALGETWSLSYSGYAWGSLVVQGVVGAFASYLAWMWMLRHYPATQLSSFTFLTPVFGLLLGVLVLGEALTPQLVLALAGVALGIVLVNRKKAAA
ncbi:MAG: putative transporter [Ramlibacter sp.]|jgi:drug/metabolite transporter (DMT)-like permease|uniref:DMT family transporter n=1 Tax=Ramlibacter sp. TaxID=1917967 RepID=UPI00260B2E2F|nr:DMT family transporter [Ramlibacter sp.]MDB5751912.1 putative transporter [Ramlibacter sp.]